MRGQINPLVAKFEKLAPLKCEERVALASIALNQREYETGELIKRASEQTDKIYLLVDGFAYRSKILYQGFQQIVSVYVPGDLLGLYDVFNTKAQCSTVALQNCLVASTGYSEFEQILLNHGPLMRSFARAIAIEASITEIWLVNMANRSAYQRVAHLFCEIFCRLRAVGAIEKDENRFEFQLEQSELGAMLGLSQVHLNRMLQELRRDGFVAVEGKRLLVRDLNALCSKCDFDPSYLCLDDPRSRYH